MGNLSPFYIRGWALLEKLWPIPCKASPLCAEGKAH
jgi:hypothetical protein